GSWNDSEDHADGAALLKYVAAESSQPGYGICNINLGILVEPLLLAVVHYGEGHVKRVFARQSLRLNHRLKLAVDAHEWETSCLDVQIRRALAARDGQQLVDTRCHALCLATRSSLDEKN